MSGLESDLERACSLLEAAGPEAIDASAILLQDLAQRLGDERASLTREQAQRLRAGARKARMLLELAGRFHRRWHAILAGIEGGYTIRGAPAEIPARRRMSVSG